MVELAKKYNGEIISADSMQIYKVKKHSYRCSINRKSRAYPHWLTDFLPSDKILFRCRFCKDAASCIKILCHGEMLIIVGGTGLCVDSLLNGYFFENRKETKKFLMSFLALYEQNGSWLSVVWYTMGIWANQQKISKNSAKRIIRA